MIESYKLSQKQLDEYKENGFTIVDVFSKEELDEFKEGMRILIRASLHRATKVYPNVLEKVSVGQEFDLGMFLLEEIDHVYQSDIYDSVAFMPEFLRLCANKKKCAYIAQILGVPPTHPIYCSIIRCRINRPGLDKFSYGWHQELFHTIPESNFVQTFAPLIHDATSKIGALQIRVGSHKEIFKQDYESSGNEYIVAVMTIQKDLLEKYKVMSIEMKLGQAILFNGKLVHKSGTNKSQHMRYSMVGTYHDMFKPEFRPLKPESSFKGKTPEKWFKERTWWNPQSTDKRNTSG